VVRSDIERLLRLEDLRRDGIACYHPVACFVVPDLVRLDATGSQDD
jgi:hypothetical protein